MDDPIVQVCYRRTFLKEVIVRVDLLSPLPGVDTALPPALGEAAVRAFPIPEPRDALKRSVEIRPKGVTSAEEKYKEWRFHGKDREKTLTITPQAVLVEHMAYRTYESLKGEFTKFLDCVGDVFQDTQSSRVGLRYVNLIELPEARPTDWAAYLAPELLAPFQFPPEQDRMAFTRVLHDFGLAFETYNLHLRLGMHNPDFPARIRQKIFVIDIDAYSCTVVDIRNVGAMLDEFHRGAQRYFELSITDGLRRVMNEG